MLGSPMCEAFAVLCSLQFVSSEREERCERRTGKHGDVVNVVKLAISLATERSP